MADAWGSQYDYDDVDDGNPFGADAGNYGGSDNHRALAGGVGGGHQAQQQDTRTTDDFLREAVGNLIETEELGEEALAHLAAQREVLDNIQNNVQRMDNTLDVADRKITEMENPWAIGPVRTKQSGQRRAATGEVGAAGFAANGGGEGFQMEGWVLKRGRVMKTWNKRYLRQVGDELENYSNKNDSKIRSKFVLKGATLNRLSYGEKDSNGAVCNKDNCFEIIQEGQRKGDTICVESTPDFNTWISCIERQINPERYKSKAIYDGGDAPRAAGANRSGVGFGNEAQDAMLDTIMDKLDNIDGISRMIGAETDDQTRIITDLASDMERVEGRVNVNKDRVQRIK